jgi:ribonuclease HI
VPDTYLLYSDGASRGNPGQAAIGAALYRVEGEKLTLVDHVSEYIGETTNNVAEYRAVIAGLEMARRQAAERLVVRADSQLLIRQLQGSYKVRHPVLAPLYARARQLLEGFPQHRLEHVPREENVVADALANAALDR